MKFYNIQMAAQISGLSTHTIRAWEKRYEALQPERSTTGRRQYTNEDIERLGLLSQLTNLGNSIGQIAKLSDHELKDTLEELTSKKNNNLQTNHKSTKKKENIDLNQTIFSLMLGLQANKLEIINHELAKAKQALGPKDFALKILSVFLSELEAKRAAGLINSPQVQAIWAILKFHIGNMIYSDSMDANKQFHQKKISLATPEGESYTFDIMTSALLCAEYKLPYMYLSTNLAAQSIAETINGFKSDILILGLSRNNAMKTGLGDFLQGLSDQIDNQCEIWMVGNAIFTSKNLSKDRNIRFFENYEQLDQALQKI